MSFETDYVHYLHEKTYRAKDVHTCFPWIAGNTFNNRVRAGLIPVAKKSGGTGKAVELSMAGLVITALVDEMSAMGAWSDRTILKYDFVQKKKHGLHKEEIRSSDDWPQGVEKFLLDHAFSVGVRVRMMHAESDSVWVEHRRQRAQRVWWARIHGSGVDGETSRFEVLPGKLLFKTKEFTRCSINVYYIFHHIVDVFGITSLKDL